MSKEHNSGSLTVVFCRLQAHHSFSPLHVLLINSHFHALSSSFFHVSLHKWTSKGKIAIFLFPFSRSLVILIYFHLISCSICLPEELRGLRGLHWGREELRKRCARRLVDVHGGANLTECRKEGRKKRREEVLMVS